MKHIDIFYQGEGIHGIDHLELPHDQTFHHLRTLILEKHGLPQDFLLFIEEGEDPADESQVVSAHAQKAGIKAHVHRCKHIAVSVTFGGETVERRFSPATTIARVKRWAAENEFGMTAEDAGEHVLQIKGSNERPAPGTHLGALAVFPACQLAFDLVPDQRINGSGTITIEVSA